MAEDDYGTVETPDDIWAAMAAGDADAEGDGDNAKAGQAGQAGNADAKGAGDGKQRSAAAKDSSAADDEGEGEEHDAAAAEGDGDGDDDGLTEEEREKLRVKARKEIGRLTRRRREAEEEAAKLREKVAAYERGEKPPADPPPEQTAPAPYDGLDPKDPEPKYEDFDDPADFHKAIGAWAARVENRKDRHERAQKEQELQQKRESEKLYTDHLSRVNEIRSQYEDWDEIASQEDVPLTPHMAQAVMESWQGPHIVYFLGKNPEIAERISKMQPWQQHREIGKLEARFEAQDTHPGKKTATGSNGSGGTDGDGGDDNGDATEAAPTKTTRSASKAPDPVTPVKTTRSAPIKTPENWSQEETTAALRKAGIL